MTCPPRLAVLMTAITAITATTVATARAENWADALFKVRTHDFGVVARNAKTQFVFEMENDYAEDVHVAGVRTNCGCTTPRVLKSDLTTYEKGGILAVFNTDSFLGRRGATITVTIDRPMFAEVQLRVGGEIRSDVTTEPGSLDFGETAQGSEVERELTVSYDGAHSDWQIERIHTGNPHLKCRAEPLPATNGRRSYRLTAKLDARTPAGYYDQPILLITNDPTAREIPVEVTARVSPRITVAPASLFLGVVRAGDEVSRKLVVKADEPFRILEIEGDDCFEFTLSDAARKVHIVPLTFRAGEQSGKLVRTIKVRTDLENGAAGECTASAAILPPK